MKLLLVADEEDPFLWDYYRPGRLSGYDMILSAGDLKPNYLDFLVTMANRPLLYVHGNHDVCYDSQPPEGCDCIDGKLVTRTELPYRIYSSYYDAVFYFPESTACFYTNGTSGFLIDINEGSLIVTAYIQDVVGFDHEDSTFILRGYMSEESDGCTVGHIRYHTLDEIRKMASQAL